VFVCYFVCFFRAVFSLCVFFFFFFFGLHCTYIYEGHVEPTIENKEYKV